MRLKFLPFILLPAAAVTAGLLFGVETLSPSILLGGGDQTARTILSLRLSRVFLAALGGGALAVSGTAFQALLRNPLADPYILGISSGAGFGSLIAIVLGFGGRTALSIGAFGGALGTTFLLFLLVRRRGLIKVETLLLAGVAIGFFFSAGMMLLLTVTRRAHLQGVLFWLMGDLGGAPLASVSRWGPIILGTTLLFLPLHRPLDLLSLGDEEALSRGLEIEKFKAAVLAGVSLVVGLTVSLTGLIGFVGLVVPHIARLLVGGRHGALLPASLSLGATFLVVSDCLSRTVIAPAELPVGAVTAAFGAPFFLYLLLGRRRGKTADA